MFCELVASLPAKQGNNIKTNKSQLHEVSGVVTLFQVCLAVTLDTRFELSRGISKEASIPRRDRIPCQDLVLKAEECLSDLQMTRRVEVVVAVGLDVVVAFFGGGVVVAPPTADAAEGGGGPQSAEGVGGVRFRPAVGSVQRRRPCKQEGSVSIDQRRQGQTIYLQMVLTIPRHVAIDKTLREIDPLCHL